MTVCNLTRADLDAMDRERRARLINCLPGYKSAMLVGTCDADRLTNLAIISSHFHLGSAPPLLAMILRPDTGRSERHTLDNLLATQCWTLNAFTLNEAAQAHQTSAPYPKNESEFDACGFSEEWKPDCPAPFVAGSPLQVACRLREHKRLEINGTHLIIGEVETLHFSSNALRSDGALSLARMGVTAISGLDTYTQPDAGISFRAASTDTAPTRL